MGDQVETQAVGAEMPILVGRGGLPAPWKPLPGGRQVMGVQSQMSQTPDADATDVI